MPEYKGFFTDYNEAVKSPKTIALVPARDGKVYEIRKTPIGIFQSPARVIGEFADLAPSFKARLPKIPMFLLYQIISFFRMISDEFKLEALVHIVYDTATDKYNVKIPKQRLTKISVDSVLEEYPENVIHVMDIHSHNTMAARFSETDNQDEKATRLYAVIGRLDKEIPDMALRASNGGKFIKINLSDVFDFEATYPEAWTDEINHAMAEALCEQEQQIGGDKPAYL
jgi:PRTRC genetic system protein A